MHEPTQVAAIAVATSITQDPAWARKSFQAGLLALLPGVGVCYLAGWWERAARAYAAGDTLAPEPFDDVLGDVRRGATACRWMLRGWLPILLALALGPAFGAGFRVLAAGYDDTEILKIGVFVAAFPCVGLLISGIPRAYATSVAWLDRGPAPGSQDWLYAVQRCDRQRGETAKALELPFNWSVTLTLALGAHLAAYGAATGTVAAVLTLLGLLLFAFVYGWSANLFAARCADWLRSDPEAQAR